MLRPKLVRFAITAIPLSLVVMLSFATTLKAQQVLGLERLYNQQTGDHFYTSNPQEAYKAVRRAGYFHVGTLGSCIGTKIQGTTALYRLTKYGNKGIRRLYTIYENEVASAQRSGYSLENNGRPECYVQTSYSDLGGRCQIYRLYNPREDRQFYTTDKSEADNAATRLGYGYADSQGFLRAGRYNLNGSRCVVDKSSLIK